ncbi:MAG: ATP synthase subunit I [Acidimicrobiales bacterium]
MTAADAGAARTIAVNGRLEGPSPATEVALDMVRRGIPFVPVAMVIGALFAGFEGAMSVAYGMALVLFNLVLSAALLQWASKISFALVASVALGGYVLRLGIIFAGVWIVKDMSWVAIVPLGITLIVTHLGLLVWELRHVSASMAHPGLKPRTPRTAPRPVAAGRR